MGGDASLGTNGALYAFSDHPEWTPNFNARVAEFGLETQVEMCRQSDGNMYHLTGLCDTRPYDGGLILREDYLEAKGFDAPETFDDLYRILKAYKDYTVTERVLFDLFHKRKDQECFERICRLFGRKYDLVAYLYYVADPDKYLPL